MLTVLILALLCGAWRVVRSVQEMLRQLPRSNEDLVFF
jgi:hypothetical protein